MNFTDTRKSTVQLTYTPSPPHIHRGYYTAARRYEKIKLTSSTRCVIFFLLHRQEHFCTNNSVKAGNDVIFARCRGSWESWKTRSALPVFLPSLSLVPCDPCEAFALVFALMPNLKGTWIRGRGTSKSI